MFAHLAHLPLCVKLQEKKRQTRKKQNSVEEKTIISGEDDDDVTETTKHSMCFTLLPLPLLLSTDLSPLRLVAVAVATSFVLQLLAVVLNCFEMLTFCRITGILSLCG